MVVFENTSGIFFFIFVNFVRKFEEEEEFNLRIRKEYVPVS